jgi:L-amino acid N-acyltransferase YncA
LSCATDIRVSLEHCNAEKFGMSSTETRFEARRRLVFPKSGLTPPLPKKVIHRNMKTAYAIRPATESDLAAINDIYNHYVLHSACTYQEKPERLRDRREWFRHHGEKHPVIVAQAGREIVGWGSLSPFHERSSYRYTVENSVYVHHQYLRRGIGSILLPHLIARARRAGHHAIIAAIDGEQKGSVALHARFDFKKTGHFKQVGFKFGRWLDVVYMELILGQPQRP